MVVALAAAVLYLMLAAVSWLSERAEAGLTWRESVKPLHQESYLCLSHEM